MMAAFFIAMGFIGSVFIFCGIVDTKNPPPHIDWYLRKYGEPGFFMIGPLLASLLIPMIGPFILGLTLAYYSF